MSNKNSSANNSNKSPWYAPLEPSFIFILGLISTALVVCVALAIRYLVYNPNELIYVLLAGASLVSVYIIGLVVYHGVEYVVRQREISL